MVKKKLYPKLQFAATEIGPTKADKLLKTRDNGPQRRISEIYVNKYAHDMKQGKWRFTGQPILLDWYGNIMDGSQRLSAIKKAGITPTLLVVRGLDPNVWPLIDVGKPRSLGNVLESRGEKYAVHIASALIMLDAYEHGMIIDGKRQEFNHEDGLSLLADNPNLRESAFKAQRVKAAGILSTSIATFTHYIFSKVNKTKADEFMHKLETGEQGKFKTADPVFALREVLREAKMSKEKKFRRRNKICMVIKAWNNYIEDKSVRRLTWRGSNNPNEPIPKIKQKR